MCGVSGVASRVALTIAFENMRSEGYWEPKLCRLVVLVYRLHRPFVDRHIVVGANIP
jgi:hypothetical protein